jgi:hypothetical protein
MGCLILLFLIRLISSYHFFIFFILTIFNFNFKCFYPTFLLIHLFLLNFLIFLYLLKFLFCLNPFNIHCYHFFLCFLSNYHYQFFYFQPFSQFNILQVFYFNSYCLKFNYYFFIFLFIFYFLVQVLLIN